MISQSGDFNGLFDQVGDWFSQTGDALTQQAGTLAVDTAGNLLQYGANEAYGYITGETPQASTQIVNTQTGQPIIVSPQAQGGVLGALGITPLQATILVGTLIIGGTMLYLLTRKPKAN